jgi:hypothetical protein
MKIRRNSKELALLDLLSLMAGMILAIILLSLL